MSDPVWTRLPDEVLEQLEAWAKAERRSRANLMEVIITKAVEERGQSAEPQSPAPQPQTVAPAKKGGK